MRWRTEPPVAHVAYVPRPRPGRAVGVTAIVLILLLAAFLLLAGPAAVLLLRLATILLTVALVSGVIGFAALRIGAAPSRRPG